MNQLLLLKLKVGERSQIIPVGTFKVFEKEFGIVEGGDKGLNLFFWCALVSIAKQIDIGEKIYLRPVGCNRFRLDVLLLKVGLLAIFVASQGNTPVVRNESETIKVAK